MITRAKSILYAGSHLAAPWRSRVSYSDDTPRTAVSLDFGKLLSVCVNGSCTGLASVRVSGAHAAPSSRGTPVPGRVAAASGRLPRRGGLTRKGRRGHATVTASEWHRAATVTH